MLKSVRSDDAAFVTFQNASSRIIDVVWFDFSGNPIRYGILKPTQTLDINTYSDHPFKSYDNSTGMEMLCNGKSVYYPESFRQIHQRLQMVHVAMRSLSCKRSLVTVTSRMASLLEMSEQFIMRFIKEEEDLKKLELPLILWIYKGYRPGCLTGVWLENFDFSICHSPNTC